MHKLKSNVMLLLLALLAASVLPSPAAAGAWEVVDQPLCMLMSPVAGRKLTISLKNTCQHVVGDVTFKPAGHSENVTVRVEGMGKCTPLTPDATPMSYVILTGGQDKAKLMFQFWLRATVNKDKWAYTVIDRYDLRLCTWYKQPQESENYKGGGSQINKCLGH